MKKIDILAYLFKRKFLWIGWIMVKRRTTMLYADNNPYMSMFPEREVSYVTLGLTQKSVMSLLIKKIEKLARKENKDD